MIARVVLELDPGSGEWKVTPDAGAAVDGLESLWEAGQVAAGLDRAACTPGAPVAGDDTRGASRRDATRKR